MSDMTGFIAHYDHENKKPPHYLSEHVAEMIDYLERFSLPAPIDVLTKISIILHDVGKKSHQFQAYVQSSEGKRGSVKHAVGGAYALYQKAENSSFSTPVQTIVDFAQLMIAGHHTALKNWEMNMGNLYTNIPEELENIGELSKIEVQAVVDLLGASELKELSSLFEAKDQEIFIYLATLTRLAMSALVDTDWLSAEKYFTGKLSEKRIYEAPSFHTFRNKLQAFYKNEKFPASTEQLNTLKMTIQQKAERMGKEQHSFFTLHAPTGTGKTMAALKFAVAHAKEHGKRRIITALPLMNLTEEMSGVYRDVFGEAHVIEDHSNAYIRDTSKRKDEEISIQLAVNNWDRPFIVTTTNQLMESLFSNKPMKLRKLHRLYESVIILDEYHKLPFHVLSPILKQLDILQTYFNVTVVMMSATPFSVVESNEIEKMELKHNPKEIIDWQPVFKQMPKRVVYERLKDKETMQSLAKKIAKESTVLTIVNTRKQAQQLFFSLQEENHSFEQIYHLSTTMCSEHRRRTLKEIQSDLKDKRKIVVVSTSVLEAGIDISFPIVYRMLAPLDALIQAAGRCNRYGEIEKGRVVIFELENQAIVSDAYEQAIQVTRRILNSNDGELGSVDQFIAYFNELLKQDKDDLNKYELTGVNWVKFEEVVSKFKMIEETRVGVICTSYEGFQKKWLDEKPTRAWWKKIQPYTVSLSDNDTKKFKEEKEVRILTVPYDKELGVIL